MAFHSPKLSSRRHLTLFVVMFAVVGLGGGWLASFAFRNPAPTLPVPNDLAKLEPQLREYVLAKIEWARQKPRRADRHATLGLVYAVNGLWQEARAAFDNAAQLDPTQPLARLYVGVAEQELGNTDAALKDYREVAARWPDFAPGQYRLAAELLRAGQTDEAGPAFERLIALAPQEWRGFAGLGEAQLRQGLNAAAITNLEKAVQLDPSAKSAHFLLGQAYRTVGRMEDAELESSLGRNAATYPMPDEWSQSATQHARLLQDQVQTAQELSEAGQALKAVEILAKAAMHHPEDLSLMNQLAIALNRSNQPRKARAILQEVLRKDSRFVPALVTLVYCESNLENHDQALVVAEQALALAPTAALAHVAKANALLALERDPEALAALEAAARIDPQNAEIQMEMGDVLWRNLSRLPEARERYETARKLNPALGAAYVRLAGLYLKLGESKEARECVRKLRQVAPNAPDLPPLEARLDALPKP